jgi:hypothetical protein
MLKVMLEQDTGQYLGMIFFLISIFFLFLSLNKGIPSNADLNQLEDHWRKCYQTHPHALTILTKLFRNMDEVKN